jgi:hypothetical protein
MSAMRQLEQTLMECPINDLAAIFSRRLMMGTENSKINDAVINDINRLTENEVSARINGKQYVDWETMAYSLESTNA